MGPRLRGDDMLIERVRNRPLLLCLGAGARPSSSLFPSPESRGMARRDGAPVTRVCPVGSMHPRLSARHGGICPLSRFSVPGDVGPHPSIVAPGAARGRGHDSRPRVPHPAPPLRTSREDAPRWTGRWEYRPENIARTILTRNIPPNPRVSAHSGVRCRQVSQGVASATARISTL